MLFSQTVFSVNCWQATTNTTCNANSSCEWKSDTWGGWCQEKGCWNYYNQTGCQTANVPGKNCTWKSGSESYSCEKIQCWSFQGTNQSACENNSQGLSCQWYGNCYSTGYNPGGNCYSISSESQCKNTSGCGWGNCNDKGCWSYTTNTTCRAAKDWKGSNCTWNSQYNYCTENGCYKYYNESDCENTVINGGLTCDWKYNSCQDISCWSYDFTNASACVNNTANISCTWSGNYCNTKDCWSFSTSADCSSRKNCVWKKYQSSGWCQELQCWSWDSYNGGNASACENNTYGKNCKWSGTNATSGWCYVPITTLSCNNITTEKDCMDTFYCWWQYNNWNNVSAGGQCKEPGTIGGIANTTIINDWNPGCYIFDFNATNCNNTIGCRYNVSLSECNEISASVDENGLNCTILNDSTLCNTISVLSSCCSWQNSSCVANKVSTSCWTQLEATPAGAAFCEDYEAYNDKSLCEKIAGAPWYMPCKWDNATSHCKANSDELFAGSSQSVVKIENKKTCEAVGGKWITENYCEGNVSVPSGRCENKFDEEENCDKACFACERKDSSGSTINSSNAESACLGSALGICEFVANTNAPNGIGFCKSKKEFKDKTAGDCDKKCSDCTYKGNSNSNDTTKKPSYYCASSKANSNGGGCKWITDNTTNNGGYCVDKGEKTCEDSCDKCKTQLDCSNKGRTAIANVTGSCKWQGTSTDGSCVANIGEDVEICWDGVDNDDDDSIDCADGNCYSDPYCGFVEGDCFGWTTNATCVTNNCEWVSDKWGSWCDFKGGQCWKYDQNEANCSVQENCQWYGGTGTGWCEKDWSLQDICMSLNRTRCESNSNCAWENDTWCNGQGYGTDWCRNFGGWCDHNDFQSKDCWQYSTPNQCGDVNGCNWHTDQFNQPHCEVNYSNNCWNYTTQANCQNSGCNWKTESWGGWCQNIFERCWSSTTLSACQAVQDSNSRPLCSWSGSWCQAACFNNTLHSNNTKCQQFQGCVWQDQAGWCEEQELESCNNASNANNQTACEADAKCSWNNPGWCDPKGGGFSGGGGGGGAIGGDCFKYDGNQSLCTNSSKINITCGWTPNHQPTCNVDWSGDCWRYITGSSCNASVGCWWYNQSTTNTAYCANLMDQCWNNMSLQGNAPACNANPYCNSTSWGGCEPTCFAQTAESGCRATSGCLWESGWCDPAGVNEMFKGMEAGAPLPLGFDFCPETNMQASADICGFGMKDMGESFGFGVKVNDFSYASICNKEKISSYAIGFGGGQERVGDGKDDITLYVYLDTNGNTSGDCTPSDNSSMPGYEFRFKYSSEWNSNTSKATESFNSYKCENSKWVATDAQISTWKQAMCGEIGGPMIAVEKGSLSKYPSLYDATKDMRVYVVTLGNTSITTNVTNPTDKAGPGWVTPGSVDFTIEDMFKYGADTAQFEDILKHGYVQYEDCFNGRDDDNDDNVDCNDFNCQYADICSGIGVNNPTYVDTSTPKVLGVKVEEYPDSALVMYDTNKPTNGSLEFYYNDSRCTSINTTIYDIGIIRRNVVREFKLWHTAPIFNGANSLSYDLTANTAYFYKLKVCDNQGKCAVSKCSNFTTSQTGKCGYCNFMLRIKAPTGWKVAYDTNRDGTMDHVQGEVCGPNAGMKINYTIGRRINIRIYSEDNSSYMEFVNASATKSAFNDKVRTISDAEDLKNGTANGTSENNITYTGMDSDTKDKIINNLHPEICIIKIPGTLNELWHCPDDLNASQCTNKTSNATLKNTSNATGNTYRIWQVPYCEFSVYASSKPAATSSGSSSGSSGSSGGGGGGGGGGAGGGGVAAVDESTVTKFFTVLTPTYNALIPITKDTIPFTLVKFKVSDTYKLVKFYFKGSTDSLTKLTDYKVYKYVDISYENIPVEGIKNVEFRFKVPLSWIKANALENKDVLLYRYAAASWAKLDTLYDRADENYAFFTSKSPGMSLFAVSSEKLYKPAAPTEEAPVEKPAETAVTAAVEEPQQIEEPKKGIDKAFIGILVLLVIIVVAIGYFVKRRRKGI